MSVGSSTGSGTRARDLLTVDRRRILVTFGAAILVFLVGAFLHPGFASAASVKAILVIASFVGLVAAGQTFVLLVGGIDLSIPWVLNAAGVLFATASLGRDSRLPMRCCSRSDSVRWWDWSTVSASRISLSRQS